jgi:hypothetical protein
VGAVPAPTENRKSRLNYKHPELHFRATETQYLTHL